MLFAEAASIDWPTILGAGGIVGVLTILGGGGRFLLARVDRLADDREKAEEKAEVKRREVDERRILEQRAHEVRMAEVIKTICDRFDKTVNTMSERQERTQDALVTIQGKSIEAVAELSASVGARIGELSGAINSLSQRVDHLDRLGVAGKPRGPNKP